METTENLTMDAETSKNGPIVSSGQKITPFLWFNGQVKEAVKFYTSVFKDAEILNQSHLPADAPGTLGKVAMATIRLHGLEFMLLDGGPQHAFTEAVSFFVRCKNQEEVDYFWDNLTSDGGEAGHCGWLKDKFGLSWQIIPDALGKYMGSPDRVKSGNAMKAMLKMKKIDVAGLERAYNGE